jgi:Fic family protein
VEDYHIFLPTELPNEFTIAEYAKFAKIPATTASRGLQTLKYLGLVREAGKRGRAKLYEKCEVEDHVSSM